MNAKNIALKTSCSGTSNFVHSANYIALDSLGESFLLLLYALDSGHTHDPGGGVGGAIGT